VAEYLDADRQIEATRRYRKLEVERIRELVQLYDMLREDPYFDGGEYSVEAADLTLLTVKGDPCVLMAPFLLAIMQCTTSGTKSNTG
jgi:hypothetical protein